MAVDTSFYRQSHPSSGDAGSNFVQAFAAGDRVRRERIADQERQEDRQKQKAVENAFRNNLVANEDGTTTLNRAGTLSELAKVDPMKALETEKYFKQEDAAEKLRQYEQMAKGMDYASRLIGSVSDQNSYTAVRNDLIAKGIVDEKTMPAGYDRNFTNSFGRRSMSYKEQAELAIKESELAIKDRESRTKAVQSGAAPKMTEAQSKALGFGRRAMLADQMVEQVMLNPNANVTSLKTQLKSNLPTWAGGIKDQSEQSLLTAKLGFIASALRKESGAAVTPQEFKQYDNMYFPQPGDTPETLAQKKALRANFIDTEKKTAGAAWQDPIPIEQTSGGAQASGGGTKTANLKQGQTKEWGGRTYKLIGSEWVEQ